MLTHFFAVDRMVYLSIIIRHGQKLMDHLMSKMVHFALANVEFLFDFFSFFSVKVLPVFSFVYTLIDVSVEESINKNICVICLFRLFLLIFLRTFLFLNN